MTFKIKIKKKTHTIFGGRGTCIALLCLLMWTSVVNGQQRPQSFWEDLRLEFKVGVNNFHGDFDRLNGTSGDNGGIPFPVEGYHLGISGSKPLNVFESFQYKLKGNFGLDFIAHKSESISTGVPVNTGLLAVVPVNIINNSFGVNAGVSFEYKFNDRFSIEPSLGLGLRFHNPQTDGFVSSINTNSGSIDLSLPGQDLRDPPFDLENFPATRTQTDDEITTPITEGRIGVKFSQQFLGNYRWFLEYSFLQFFDDMFDNTSEASTRDGGAEDDDSMSLLSMGLSFPVLKEQRRSEIVTQRRVQVNPQKARKVSQIQNVANLITTDEDLRKLQEIMSDKILLYDTPGVRFNELAAKTENRQVPLANTSYTTEMVFLPSSSYIMGLNAVDELNIQVQGKKRISINSFLIDKYEVTNQQYRIFLTAMGAIDPPASGIGGDIDTTIANLDLSNSSMSFQELLEKAELDDYALHRPRPKLEGPEDLLPDSTKWQQLGLEDVVDWGSYFRSEFYANYPVVCVNWYQAKLFAAWADKRLPTESEWEYAARSGVSGRIFPWDGLDVQTNTGKYRANFKQGRGIYQADGYAIMAPVESFVPNDFGLYNMAGNVSEWVLDSYNPTYAVLQNVGTSNFVTPFYVNDQEPRKVHRGGSWQSTEFFIGVGVRNFENKTNGTTFIGFRTAKTDNSRTFD